MKKYSNKAKTLARQAGIKGQTLSKIVGMNKRSTAKKKGSHMAKRGFTKSVNRGEPKGKLRKPVEGTFFK